MGDYLDLHVQEVLSQGRDIVPYTTVVLANRNPTRHLLFVQRFGLPETVFTLPLAFNLQPGDRIRFNLRSGAGEPPASFSSHEYGMGMPSYLTRDGYDSGTIFRKTPGDNGEEQELMSFDSLDMRVLEESRRSIHIR